MSLEMLDKKFPMKSPIRIGWKIGTIVFRVGHLHLIQWEKGMYYFE